VAEYFTFTPKSVATALTKIRTQIILSAAGDGFALRIIQAVDYTDIFAEHAERPFVRPITQAL